MIHNVTSPTQLYSLTLRRYASLCLLSNIVMSIFLVVIVIIRVFGHCILQPLLEGLTGLVHGNTCLCDSWLCGCMENNIVPIDDLNLFVAAYAPAGTPVEIVDRLSREIKAVISEPPVAEKMIAQGQTPVGSTPKELAAVLARETPVWADLIKQSGAKVE